MRRVVVTGMGAVTPIGIGVDTFWENVKKKTLGFGEITRFDTTDYKVHIAAEVKDFAGKDYMDFKAAKRMELFCQYAVAAAKEAFEQAGLDMEKEDPFRVGCSIGSGIGSLQAAETACHKIAEKGPSRVNPLLFLSNGSEHFSGSSTVESAVNAVKPATPTGQILASVPPASITSASPHWILRYASPMECVPVAHAVTTFRLFPFSPS